MKVRLAGLALSVSLACFGQDPTATLEGQVQDQTGGAIRGAVVQAISLRTGFSRSQITTDSGAFTFASMPVGDYEVRASAPNFAEFVQKPVVLNLNQTVRISAVLDVAGERQSVNVEANAAAVEAGSNTLGKVVTEREVLDLPLNGRNFTQLGLLQAGVAPLTTGVSTAGGSLRSGQAYAVDGQRPESNSYLLDGARNVNRADGGFALRTPIDAIAEFRILTHTAAPEYGGTSGATTSVVTKSGGNEFHGDVYEFLRNDKLDARNFFAEQTEPLKQNQFGVTLGGPISKNRTFFFAYYEGFRNRQGVTKAAAVPTPEQRSGDFSGLRDPETGEPVPLINYLTGQPVPNNQIPDFLQSPVSKTVLQYYPLGNISPSISSSTEILANNSDQGGARVDHVFSTKDQLSFRYAHSTGFNINPLSIKGADVPGFPVGDDLTTQMATVSETHLFSPQTLNSFRASYFRHFFVFDKRLNRTPPRDLGFNYDSSLDIATGPPFFIVNGYASVGDPITGPRRTTQHTYEVSDGLAYVAGAHSLKFGGEFRRTQINALQGIASNGFFVFAPFPTSDAFANFLLGRPVVFFQAGGDLSRGLRNWDLGAYAQDEWRATRRLTLNVGLRYEISTPFGDIRDRMNAFAPGRQSTVFSDAPMGVLFPGDQGIEDRIAPIYYRGFMPRAGFAWDPTGSGRMSVRAAYGIFYDGFTNGANSPYQAPLSALPWTQAYQLGGPTLDYVDPYHGQPPPFATLNFPQPTTMLTIEQGMRPPYAQDWNLSIQRSLAGAFLLELQYVGTKGTRLPRFIEANPAVYGPGATIDNAERRRIYANCPTDPNEPCELSSVGLLINSTNSTYHAFQATLSRRFSAGLGFQFSYWFSKTLDYVSSLNLSGSAPRLVSGENDVAQNPFDLQAEHGPSLFDARHRFVSSWSYQIPLLRQGSGLWKALLADWQWNGIAVLSSATPYTVYDSQNVALQAQFPEISGFSSGRPDVVSDPNVGPHTVEQWVSRSAFRRLDPVTEAGNFGNAGRNIVRGPAFGNLDLSLTKKFPVSEAKQFEFRAECFNVTNHPNFGLPVNDLASPNFGRILESGPPRLFQFGLKLLF